MIKKFSLVMVLIMITTITVYSNTKLSNKHKGMEKDGKAINCAYCHEGDLKIAKKKKQLKDNTLNGVEFSKIKSCSGEGCHD